MHHALCGFHFDAFAFVGAGSGCVFDGELCVGGSAEKEVLEYAFAREAEGEFIRDEVHEYAVGADFGWRHGSGVKGFGWIGGRGREDCAYRCDDARGLRSSVFVRCDIVDSILPGIALY